MRRRTKKAIEHNNTLRADRSPAMMVNGQTSADEYRFPDSFVD